MGSWIRGRAIGRGSTASVSIATDEQSGDIFAVKSAKLSKSEFLQREQKILCSLNCPQIVGYVANNVTTEQGETLYNLFMEYAPGGTLTELIQKQGGSIKEAEIRVHTREILHGLSYLHSRGITHCDIKGRNVLIGADGAAKIADFGCSRLNYENCASIGISGTPAFMAPEVARGEDQGYGADVWAVACTVIEMITGRPPWPELLDPVSAVYKIGFTDETPKIPSSTSEELKDFLGKCLRRDAKERLTVDQLLKHPFLVDSISKNSPTSVLDQDFWDSFEEEEETERPSSSSGDLKNSSLPNSVSERMRRVSCSRAPNWGWEEDWVTIRCGGADDESITENCSSSSQFEEVLMTSLLEETEVHTSSIFSSITGISEINERDCLCSRIGYSKFCLGLILKSRRE
ncbi:hypothetical protein Sjap_003140 [Stephania japonica]|uniref:Protein kinase domain-containing protein n=1 Tax=Stephania japonica TaxID=461633 RepID=A0AAP0KP36_9MAGN